MHQGGRSRRKAQHSRVRGAATMRMAFNTHAHARNGGGGREGGGRASPRRTEVSQVPRLVLHKVCPGVHIRPVHHHLP